jgi:hypothetical protein
VDVVFVFVLRKLIAAPATDPPLASVTVPFNCAAAAPCAKAELAQPMKIAIPIAIPNAIAKAEVFLIAHLVDIKCSIWRRRPNNVRLLAR